MVRGTIIYLISTEWFLVWVRYLQIYGCNEVIFFDENEEEHRFSEDSITQQLNQHWITRPSKINNLQLLDEYEEDLKPELKVYRDVVPLPEGLWEMFKSVYGGGPEIRRVFPELYPMIVYRVFLDGSCDFKSELRRKMHSETAPIEKVLDSDERRNDQ